MRPFVATAAVAILMTGIAVAQYKTPPQPAPAPGTVQATPANPLQMATPSPDEELQAARRIPREQAMKLVKEKKAVYIDVRSKESYDEGHLPGAISIPLSQLQARFKDLPLQKFLITYCA